MTLIFSFACHGVAVQVADRLVSVQRGRSLSPLDQIANKLIIYRARDAIVSIGYAGQAFIGDIPTDEWLAQLISGVIPARGPDGDGAVGMGPNPNNWDIGKALRRIRDDLPPHIAPELVVQICAVGHQVNRHGLVRPIVYEMELRRNEVVRFFQSARHWRPGAGCISSIGVEIGDEERKRVLMHLRDAKPPFTGEQIAQFLTETIRKHSQPGVGPHTSAVIIPRPGSGPVQSKFLPLTPHHILLRTKGGDRPLEADYAPWIVGPGLIKPPTVEIGTSHYGVGGLEVMVEGKPPKPGGLVGFIGIVRRFPLPARLRR